MSKVTVFKVEGNWGTLTCNAATGDVISYDTDNSDWEKPGDGYDDIIRLDVAEWRATYPGEDITAHQWDVLDFGSTDASGHYEPAIAEWREQMRKDANAQT